ncbi:MAG: hypothetical protein RSD19_05150, partial [Oscillospiraceae bacterium]
MTLGGVSYDIGNMLTYLPVSALYIISMIFGYAGLRYIELSISSPICNSSGALVAILCFVFLKQTMTAPQIVAVSMICAGILPLGVLDKKNADRQKAALGIVEDKKYTNGIIAILFPILYCIIDALGTFADSFYLDVVMDETTANISYELTFMIVGLLA